jgi:iron complex outermembrane receptor protein/vitamin B12 transporter
MPAPKRLLAVFLSLLAAPLLHAVTVHGTVSDPLGHPIVGATVALIQNGKVITTAHSLYDGSYQLNNSTSGQFNVLAAGVSFRQLTTKSFYGAVLDSVEQNVVLEPEWVRTSIVVTATGTPQPEAQVSASITDITKPEFANRATMVDTLRQVSGFDVVQSGQRGGVTSVFIRGGNSDSNKVLLDGVPIEDIGGRFDLSTLSTTGISSVEAYRGPNSVLWGSDAAAGVMAFDTPRGTTPFPSLLYEGDAGSFHTYRNEVQLGGTLRRLDYYGGFADLQTKNSLPMDEYHNINEVVNLGFQPSGATSIRVTARNADIATGLPGTYAFFGMSNDGKESDQDIFMSGTIDHSFSDAWHGLVRYGMARKREESQQWYPAGNLVEGNYYGNYVTITGANGYAVHGHILTPSILFRTATISTRRPATPSRRTLTLLPDFVSKTSAARRMSLPTVSRRRWSAPITTTCWPSTEISSSASSTHSAAASRRTSCMARKALRAPVSRGM